MGTQSLCEAGLGLAEVEGLDDGGVGSGDAVRLGDEAEGTLVVPHGPADAVSLERGGGIVEPGGAHGGGCELAENAELTAVDGDVVGVAPLFGEGEDAGDAVRVPAGEAVLGDKKLAGEASGLGEVGGDVVGGGGVRDVAEGRKHGVRSRWHPGG